MTKRNLTPIYNPSLLSEVLGVIGLSLLLKWYVVFLLMQEAKLLSLFHFRASLIRFLKHLSA